MKRKSKAGTGPLQAHTGRNHQTQSSTIKRDRNGFIKCRVCGCTEVDACSPGCSWVEVDLCSVCEEAIEVLVSWWNDCHTPKFAPLIREAEKRAGDQPIPYGLTRKGNELLKEVRRAEVKNLASAQAAIAAAKRLKATLRGAQ